jgi:two-component system, OmpR family, sensor kinase
VAAALAPLAAGVGLAVVLTAVAPRAQVWVAASVAETAALIGGLGAAAVAAAVLGRRLLAARAARAAAAAAAIAQADRRRFLLRLDHELKNPITAMRAGLANLEDLLAATGQGDGSEAAAALRSVTAQTVRLSRLVGDLRKIAEVETQAWTPAAVDVPEVLGEIAAAAAGHWGRQVVVSLPRAPWPLAAVLGDRDLVFLLLFNLVANAMKFSGPADTVEVRAFDDPPWVTLEVADTGAGIPGDELDLVWEELARGRNAAALPGTGLGLPLVRTIAARHGGTVALRSREGQGTIVTVRLPGAGVADVSKLRHPGDNAGTPPPYLASPAADRAAGPIH